MAVVIKELIIQGKVDGSSQTTDEDIIEIINLKIPEISTQSGLKETDKRQLIEECVSAVLKELEFKFRY